MFALYERCIPIFPHFWWDTNRYCTVSNKCASWVSFPFSSTYPFMIVGLIPIRVGDFEHVE